MKAAKDEVLSIEMEVLRPKYDEERVIRREATSIGDESFLKATVAKHLKRQDPGLSGCRIGAPDYGPWQPGYYGYCPRIRGKGIAWVNMLVNEGGEEGDGEKGAGPRPTDPVWRKLFVRTRKVELLNSANGTVN